MARSDRDSFDLAVQTSLLNTLRSLGEDWVTSILFLLGRDEELGVNSLVSRLEEVEVALDELFTKFSEIIKQVTVLQACSQLKLEPPKLGGSLFWMIEELRASLRKVYRNMRSPAVTMLHDTFSFCFDQVLSTLGGTTKLAIYDFLSRKGIGKNEISSRFQDVEDALVQIFGQGRKSVLIGALARFCEEYSVALNLGYGDSLNNRMTQLTEHILMEKLAPKHFRKGLDTKTFEDKLGAYAAWTD